MPLDLVARLDDADPRARELLERAALASGLAPPDLGILEAHKTDQVRRHAPGWIYRHTLAIQVSQPGLMLAGAIGFGLLGANGLMMPAIACVALAFALAFMPLLVTSAGPARWEETHDPDLRLVHPEVRDAALRLGANFPQARFILGELYQDRARLDPYLVAEYRGVRVLLGIWDEDRLILCA